MRVRQPHPYSHAPVQAPQTTQEKPISEYPPLPCLEEVGFFAGVPACGAAERGISEFHASETLALPASATLGTRASHPQFQPRKKNPTPLSRPPEGFRKWGKL